MRIRQARKILTRTYHDGTVYPIGTYWKAVKRVSRNHHHRAWRWGVYFRVLAENRMIETRY